jgi:hypothetical protein
MGVDEALEFDGVLHGELADEVVDEAVYGEAHGLSLGEAALLHVEDHLFAHLGDAGLVLGGVRLALDGDGREVPARAVIYGPAVEPHKGKCKVQANQLTDMSPEVGGATLTVQRYRVDIPVSAGPIEVGDLIETRGRQFRVTGLHDKTWQTAQRLPVEEVT